MGICARVCGARFCECGSPEWMSEFGRKGAYVKAEDGGLVHADKTGLWLCTIKLYIYFLHVNNVHSVIILFVGLIELAAFQQGFLFFHMALEAVVRRQFWSLELATSVIFYNNCNSKAKFHLTPVSFLDCSVKDFQRMNCKRHDD